MTAQIELDMRASEVGISILNPILCPDMDNISSPECNDLHAIRNMNFVVSATLSNVKY